jgi:uncharacterized protein (TIGR02147 family)
MIRKYNYFFQNILVDTYSQKKEQNCSYSIRAFARDLEINSSILSQLFNGTTAISYAAAMKFSEKLGFTPQIRFLFLKSIQLYKKETGIQKVEKKFQYQIDKDQEDLFVFSQKNNDLVTRIISNWYYYAIMELTLVEGFVHSNEWIGQQLNIPTIEASTALEDLKALGILKVINGRLTKVLVNYSSGKKSNTSAHLKKRQSEVLKKSLLALQEQEFSLRSHQAMTMAFNKKMIPIVKHEITQFLRHIRNMSETTNPEDVYELQVSFFSLTQSFSTTTDVE